MGKDKGEDNKAEILLGSVIDHPTRMKRQMNFSKRGWQKSRNCYSFFSWRTLTYQTSPGNTTQ